MENTPYAPSSLSSSALMMLASSSEAHEASQRSAPSHTFSAPSLDKDHAVPPPPFNSTGFVYRPDILPSSLYAPLPPFPRPSMSQGMGLVRPGGSFPHLGPHQGAEPYQSAFSPAKKKPEEVLCSSTFAAEKNSEPSFEKGVEGLKTDSPSVKEERPSSMSSAGGDTGSEVHSDSGDLLDRATPDSEGRNLRKSRKRPIDGNLPCCPVCGLTLRPGEMETHVAVEQEKLDRIIRGGRKSRDSTPSSRKTLPSPPVRKGKDSPSPEAASKARFESYRRIRANRQTRLNGKFEFEKFFILYARSRSKKKRGGEEMVCPVCNDRMTCTAEELTVHVDLCLRKREAEEEGEAMVDVEGEGEDGQFEEYTWAGQTRVRASSMLEGGYSGSGFQTISCKRMSDDEGELDVDGDDTEEYGEPQDHEAAAGHLSSVTPGTSRSDPDADVSQSEKEDGSSQGPLVKALKARLRELEGSRDTRQKCQICLSQYEEPLVSVQCWHVHCRQCWFQTLGAKKLCPQCNMITSMANLRRLYL
ncbi:hypothetical protein ACOMHN_037240 [Nucella lapillus]